MDWAGNSGRISGTSFSIAPYWKVVDIKLWEICLAHHRGRCYAVQITHLSLDQEFEYFVLSLSLLPRRLEFQIHFTQRFMDALLKNKLRSQGSAALVSSAAVGGSLIGRVPYHYLGMNSAGCCYRRPGWTFFFWEARFLPKNKTLIMPWSSTFVNSWDWGGCTTLG